MNKLFLITLFSFLVFSCQNKSEKKAVKNTEEKVEAPEGMVWVAEKTFLQGAKNTDNFAMPREKPAHQVKVDGFFIDIHEVTNKQFANFVAATNYVTIAERPIDWEEIKKNLPPNTPKPADSILQPGSLTFNREAKNVVSMENYTQWWKWQIGANWKHPDGPNSTIEGKDNFPVVHVAFEDAKAYCKWANRRLPTEAEWESAAQGNLQNATFTWGNNPELLNKNANTWQGNFPTKNESLDGFEYISPIKSYPPNSIGLYDMVGNVWELTSDLFNVNYYQNLDTSTVLENPTGAEKPYSPSNPYQPEVIIKGGSFLCHASYCASFRISAKMGTSFDSASDHVGFRTVATLEMLQK